MDKFFFDIINGEHSHSDDTGVEIDRQQVPRIANQFLTDIAKDETSDGDLTHIVVQVRNGSGQQVYWGELTLQSKWQTE